MASYAEIASRNSDQSAEEASAGPVSSVDSVVSSEVTDTSYQTTSGPSSSSSTSTSHVQVVPAEEASRIEFPGPKNESPNESFTHDETIIVGEDDESQREKFRKKSGLRKPRTKHEKELLAWTSGLGMLNLCAAAGIGYLGWKKFQGTERFGLKTFGLVVGGIIGLGAVEAAVARGYSYYYHEKQAKKTD